MAAPDPNANKGYVEVILRRNVLQEMRVGVAAKDNPEAEQLVLGMKNKIANDANWHVSKIGEVVIVDVKNHGAYAPKTGRAAFVKNA